MTDAVAAVARVQLHTNDLSAGDSVGDIPAARGLCVLAEVELADATDGECRGEIRGSTARIQRFMVPTALGRDIAEQVADELSQVFGVPATVVDFEVLSLVGGRTSRGRRPDQIVRHEEFASEMVRQWLGQPKRERAKCPAVIVGFDGTLCDEGAPVIPGLRFVYDHAAEGRAILVVTARPQRLATRIHRWLTEHLRVDFIGPVCRPWGDERPDVDVKSDLFHRLSGRYEIVAAIDDRKDVCDLWHELGVPDVVEVTASVL
jgi:hypothetical protein